MSGAGASASSVSQRPTRKRKAPGNFADDYEIVYGKQGRSKNHHHHNNNNNNKRRRKEKSADDSDDDDDSQDDDGKNSQQQQKKQQQLVYGLKYPASQASSTDARAQRVAARGAGSGASAVPIPPILPIVQPVIQPIVQTVHNNNNNNNNNNGLQSIKPMDVLQTGSAAFGLSTLAHSDSALVANNKGMVLHVDSADNDKSLRILQRMDLPVGIKTVISDSAWTYAGCDNGLVYDLTSKDNVRVAYRLTDDDIETAAVESTEAKEAKEAKSEPIGMEIESKESKQELKQPKKSSKKRKQKRKGNNDEVASKDILFVVDRSFSMKTAGRFSIAMRNIAMTLQSACKPQDSATVMLFNHHISMLAEKQSCAGAEFDALMNSVHGASDSWATGDTALWASIMEAYSKMIPSNASAEDESKELKDHAEKWIVVLSDGQDTASPYGTLQKVQDLAKTHSETINVIVLAIGDFHGRDELESICHATERGMFLHIPTAAVSHSAAATASAIDEAFKRITQVMNSRIVGLDVKDGYLAMSDTRGHFALCNFEGEAIWKHDCKTEIAQDKVRLSEIGGWLCLIDPDFSGVYRSVGNQIIKHAFHKGDVLWKSTACPTGPFAHAGVMCGALDDVYLWIACGSCVIAYNKKTGAFLMDLQCDNTIVSIAFSVDGSDLFVADAAQTLTRFKVDPTAATATIGSRFVWKRSMHEFGSALAMKHVVTQRSSSFGVDSGSGSGSGSGSSSGSASGSGAGGSGSGSGAGSGSGSALGLENKDKSGKSGQSKLYMSTTLGFLVCMDPDSLGVDASMMSSSASSMSRSASSLASIAAAAASSIKPSTSVAIASSSSIPAGSIVVECVLQGSKLRVRPASAGFDADLNVQFPRDLREDGARFIVEKLVKSQDGQFYRAMGKITKVV